MRVSTPWRVAVAVLAVAALSALPSRADTWRGTAPFCSGDCLRGEQEIGRNKCGDGGCCITGSKALCRNASPTCPVRETNVECKGVVMICDNGFFTQTTNKTDWHSCSKYACGACFGFWSDWREAAGATGIGLAGTVSPLSVPSQPRPPAQNPPQLPYGPDTCKAGFVWREAIANDHVCVVPGSRNRARDDNAHRVERVSRTDHASGPDTCVQGFVWREVIPQDHVCVPPAIREQTRAENGQLEANRVRGAGW